MEKGFMKLEATKTKDGFNINAEINELTTDNVIQIICKNMDDVEINAIDLLLFQALAYDDNEKELRA